MSDNNFPKNEDEELEQSQAAESTEETVEKQEENTVEETVEQAADEAVREQAFVDAQDVQGEVQPVVTYETAEAVADEKPKSKTGLIVGIVLIVLVIIGLAIGGYMFATRNKYNKAEYINVSGRTVQEVAEGAQMTVEEFLAEYDLPADMPADTEEASAYYTIPAGKIAQMYGMDFATLKETLQLPDTITETTTWGEAEGETTLGAYVGEEYVEEFKQSYNIGDDVTKDTKWKEIRTIVDKANLQQRLDAENAAKQTPAANDGGLTEQPTEAPAGNTGEAVPTEVPAA